MVRTNIEEARQRRKGGLKAKQVGHSDQFLESTINNAASQADVIFYSRHVPMGIAQLSFSSYTYMAHLTFRPPTTYLGLRSGICIPIWAFRLCNICVTKHVRHVVPSDTVCVNLCVWFVCLCVFFCGGLIRADIGSDHHRLDVLICRRSSAPIARALIGRPIRVRRQR